MRRYSNILALFVLALFLTILQACGNMQVVTSDDNDVVKLFAGKNTTYRVKGDINLRGKTLKIGDGSTLVFSGGSLNNGTLMGNIKFKGVKRGSLNVRFSKCNITGLVPIYNNGDVVGLISSCVYGCKLMDDLTIDKPIYLKTSVNGNGHSITCSEKAPVALYINDNRTPIIIEKITLRKLIPKGTINQNYAIHSTNSSNITIKNSFIDGRVRFANTTMSDAKEGVSKNISIVHSNLYADFSSCPQGWEYGQDHLAFYSVKNVIIDNCTIESKNVNRVMKTSAYFHEKEYSHPQNCTDGVVFRCNKVVASSDKGKQFWDMFCGTVNVLIESNKIDLHGFTRFVEDKAYQKKYKGDSLHLSHIVIKNNTVSIEYGNLFQFKANSEVDAFEVIGNTFTIYGANINPNSQWNRQNVFLLQGYRSCVISNNTITLKDEAIGLPLASVSFDCLETKIVDNVIVDASQLFFRSATSSTGDEKYTRCNRFEYCGNRRYYSQHYTKKSRMELYVVHSNIGVLFLSIPGEPISDDNIIEFGAGTTVRNLFVSVDSPKRKKLFRINNAKDVNITINQIPVGTVQQGTDWTIL